MDAQNLSQHRWKNRVLLVYFENADQETYQNQIQSLKKNQQGLAERKLVVYQINHGLFKMGLDDTAPWEKVDTPFLQKLNRTKDAPFLVQLIGLDGGIKHQKSELLSTTELFGIIDAMPMRMRELRIQKKNTQ